MKRTLDRQERIRESEEERHERAGERAARDKLGLVEYEDVVGTSQKFAAKVAFHPCTHFIRICG